MQFSAVDLPQPDGPSRAMNSPRRIVSVTSCSALQRAEVAAEARRAQLREVARTAMRHRRRSPASLTLGRYFLCAPISSSQRAERLDQLVGLERQLERDRSAISLSYSGRPNSLIASWLSSGAMSSVTSFTAGPGIEIALVVGLGLLLLG